MRRGLRNALSVAMLIALGGCSDTLLYVPPSPASWPPPAPPPPPPVAAAPIPSVTIDLPPDIAGDHEAERFLLLNTLVENGLVLPQDAAPRRAANLGGLLPYDQPPPAAGLDQPLPLGEFANRLARLGPTPADPAQAAERAVLMDRLLPEAPLRRAPAARRDAEALERGRGRIDSLARLGLVSPDEQAREQAAIDRLKTELAAQPPPPPPSKRQKPPSRPASSPGLKPGDVPGGAIPASGPGPLGVHLLSMASPTMTDRAVEALKKENPELAALTFKAVKTVIPELGTTYRLLAGPLPAAEAETMCRSLRARGQSCAVSGF